MYPGGAPMSRATECDSRYSDKTRDLRVTREAMPGSRGDPRGI